MSTDMTTFDRLDTTNACYVCCDRHADLRPTAPALQIVDEDRSTTITFGDLKSRAHAFAQQLAGLGIKQGDCVAALVSRGAELTVAALGTWRIGAVFAPLFTAFGEEAIRHRIDQANVKVLLIEDAFRDKIAAIANLPPVILATDLGYSSESDTAPDRLGESDAVTPPIGMDLQAPFLRMFTSGTTGKPKSLDVPLRAFASIESYMRKGIELSEEDAFWNLADPGWAYGLYYGLIGPLMLGKATLYNKRSFDALSAIEIIRNQHITNLAGSPTAFRMLMAAGPEAMAPIRNQLRLISSAGEPLTEDIVNWFREHLGVVVRDHYGQTELGMVMIESPSQSGQERSDGGLALPGFTLKIVDEDGNEVDTGVVGELAVDCDASPLFWFAGYRETCPRNEALYRTGDAAIRTANGRISFFGRTDDVITSSGYRIGPYDVESALMEDDQVLEAAVVGKPDEQRTEIIKAFIVLKPGVAATPSLVEHLKMHVRKRLSAHAYPREIEFVPHLPKTPSGKIMRNALKNAA